MKLFNCEFYDIYNKLQTKRVYAKNYKDAIKCLNEKYRVFNLISIDELDENLKVNNSAETNYYKNLAYDKFYLDENEIEKYNKKGFMDYIIKFIENTFVFMAETLIGEQRTYKVFQGHSNPPKPPKLK